MRSVPLTQGRFALVDDDDYERVSKHSWCVALGTYAQSNIKGVRVYMHRFIMNAQPEQEIDHKNRNTFDNRRENLRICSHQENMANMVRKRKNLTGYRGVFFDKRRNKYYAQLMVNGKTYSSGYCLSAIDAARAYNKMNVEHNGEFGVLNEV